VTVNVVSTETPAVSTQAEVNKVDVATTAPVQPAATQAITTASPLKVGATQQTINYTDLFDAYTVVDPGDGRFDLRDLNVPTSVLSTNVLDEAIITNHTALGVVYIGNVYKLIIPGQRPRAQYDSTAQTDPATLKSWWKAAPVAWGTPGAAYIKKRRTQLVDVPAVKTLPSGPVQNAPLAPVVSITPVGASQIMPAADPLAPTQPMGANDFQEYLAATAILNGTNSRADASSRTWAAHVLAALKDYSLTESQKAILASGRF